MDSVRGLVKKIRQIVAVNPKHEFKMPDRLARKVRKQFARERMAEALRQAPVRIPDVLLRKKARNKRRNQRKHAAERLEVLHKTPPQPAPRKPTAAELEALKQGHPVVMDEPLELGPGDAIVAKGPA